MRRVLVAAGSVLVAIGVINAPSAAANPVPSPPYVSRAVWTHVGGMASLRVYPTRAGRAASVASNGAALVDDAADEAWSEVLTLAPDAGSPGMHDQFLCHWHFAELAQPGKLSWNLEPWRPVVSEEAMVGAGCNPGGPEESA